MHPQLELMITLHDLELMIKETTEDAVKHEAMGFKFDQSEQLLKARINVEKQVEPAILERYHRLRERYGRPVVPVINGVCCGCYIRVPTGQPSDTQKNQSVSNCVNCGRFLYWV